MQDTLAEVAVCWCGKVSISQMATCQISIYSAAHSTLIFTSTHFHSYFHLLCL